MISVPGPETRGLDRQTERQMDRQTDRQIGRYTDRQVNRQTDRQTDKKMDRQAYRQIDIQTVGQQNDPRRVPLFSLKVRNPKNNVDIRTLPSDGCDGIE